MDLIHYLKEREESRKDNFSFLQAARQFDTFIKGIRENRFPAVRQFSLSCSKGTDRYSIEITKSQVIKYQGYFVYYTFLSGPVDTIAYQQGYRVYLACDRDVDKIVKITIRNGNVAVEDQRQLNGEAFQLTTHGYHSHVRWLLDRADCYYNLPIWLGLKNRPKKRPNLRMLPHYFREIYELHPEVPPFLYPKIFALKICLQMMKNQSEPIYGTVTGRKLA